MTSNLIITGFPDDDDEIHQKSISSYVSMMQEILFNIHLVNCDMWSIYIKDMCPSEYVEYKRLITLLKNSK